MWSARCGSVRDLVVRGFKAVNVEADVLGRAPVEPPTLGLGAPRVRCPGRCCSRAVQGTGTTDAIVVKVCEGQRCSSEM